MPTFLHCSFYGLDAPDQSSLYDTKESIAESFVDCYGALTHRTLLCEVTCDSQRLGVLSLYYVFMSVTLLLHEIIATVSPIDGCLPVS